MELDDTIPIPKIPEALRSAVIAHIRQFAVTMVVCGDDESKGLPCGGVLCTVGGRSGILTARHVWDELRRAQKLLLMLSPKHPYRIDRQLLHACTPVAAKTIEVSEACVPDIAFIVLPEGERTSIEAQRKSFYSIDRRRLEPDKFDLFGDSGFWIVIGSPVELMRPGDGIVASLSYATDVERQFEHRGWDYMYVNLNLEGNSGIPDNLKGMSGGGLWRARLWATPDRRQFSIPNLVDDVLLQGITFLQTEMRGRQLISHGPRSVYEGIPELVDKQIGAGINAR
jgi:hypothetical protein